MMRTANNVTASSLFKLVVPVLRCDLTDMRDILVLGLGSLNPASFESVYSNFDYSIHYTIYVHRKLRKYCVKNN